MTFLARVGISSLGGTAGFRFMPVLAFAAGLLAGVPAMAQTSTYPGGWVEQRTPYYYPPECAAGAPVTSSCTARNQAALNAAQDGYTVEITNTNSNVSISWTYLNSDNNSALTQQGDSLCSQDVSINFSYLDNNGNAQGSGTCVLSQGQALVESSNATLSNCDPNNPASWTSSCVMPPICPTAGSGNTYSCGTDTLCVCASAAAGSGASSVCPSTYSCNNQTCVCHTTVVNGNTSSQCEVGTSSNYWCGGKQTCACTPQGSAGATASYCAVGQASSAQTPCIPQPDYNTLNPTQLNSPYTTTIQQELVNLANNQNVQANFGALVNDVTALSNETNGCRNANP